MEEIILIGGGGHCRSCIDVIEQEGHYEIAGIVDKEEFLGEKLFGYTYIGTDDDLPELTEQYQNFLITVGQLKINEVRKKLFDKLHELGANFPVIVSPLAYVSSHTVFGEGTIVMHQAVVNAGAAIGVNSIINTKALIEHDAYIGSHCHISTGTIVNGQAEIEDSCFVGSNSIISNNISVCSDSIIGSGANVVKDITQSGIYVGNPAKRIS